MPQSIAVNFTCDATSCPERGVGSIGVAKLGGVQTDLRLPDRWAWDKVNTGVAYCPTHAAGPPVDDFGNRGWK